MERYSSYACHRIRVGVCWVLTRNYVCVVLRKGSGILNNIIRKVSVLVGVLSRRKLSCAISQLIRHHFFRPIFDIHIKLSTTCIISPLFRWYLEDIFTVEGPWERLRDLWVQGHGHSISMHALLEAELMFEVFIVSSVPRSFPPLLSRVVYSVGCLVTVRYIRRCAVTDGVPYHCAHGLLICCRSSQAELASSSALSSVFCTCMDVLYYTTHSPLSWNIKKNTRSSDENLRHSISMVSFRWYSGTLAVVNVSSKSREVEPTHFRVRNST